MHSPVCVHFNEVPLEPKSHHSYAYVNDLWHSTNLEAHFRKKINSLVEWRMLKLGHVDKVSDGFDEGNTINGMGKRFGSNFSSTPPFSI